MRVTHLRGTEAQAVIRKQSVNVGSGSDLIAALADTRGARERHILRLTLYRQEHQGPWQKVANLHMVSAIP